jgi:Na+:H+ antiporter, NhaC family
LSQRFSLGEASLPLVIAAVLMGGMILTGSTDLYWPLLAGALVAAVLAFRKGSTWVQLRAAAWHGIKATLIALSILVLVGFLIGVWKASGTVPAMVYYGLGFASPGFLVPVAFLLSLAVSMMLGTSIGTLSTLGVAIMGVAHGVGAPLPMVAGALVSGALFGDRSSPLAGSLNLNVAMTGTDLRQMLGVLAPTGVAAAVLSLAGYLLFGTGLLGGGTGAGAGASEAAGAAMREAIAAHFAISPWLLIPPVLVLALAFVRLPVRWALGCGILAGVALGMYFGDLGPGGALQASFYGYTSHAGDASLDRIFSGGGLLPMWRQFTLILVAGAFSGIMEQTGMMGVVFARLVESVRRPVALAGSTMLISISTALVAANQALPIIITGRMLRPAYDKAGLPATLLSRSLADSGTVIAGVIPWNLMGILAAASLGIPVRTFFPYTFFALSLPFVSLAFTAMEHRHRRGALELARADAS